MDFKDSIKQLSDRIHKLKDQITTEEATKNAFIMPFIQTLGYDVFNPFEIIPEYVCDIGTKKGEKIDYALLKEGKPVILIECKHWAQDLNLHDNQLIRYFNVSEAKFGILTNGIVYRFYTDLEELNKMDEKPFLEIDLTDLRENQISELKKFHKSYFDIDSIVNTASELKYTTELKNLIIEEMNNPSEALVRLFTKQVYSGSVTSRVVDQFTLLIKRSFSHIISDIITDRLKSALNKEEGALDENKNTEEVVEIEAEPKRIVTTEEELEGYYIVKSILRTQLPNERISHRDAVTYFSILLDDSNRKPICRLYFNGTKKYIATLDQNKKETKHEIVSLDDIYQHAETLLATVGYYN